MPCLVYVHGVHGNGACESASKWQTIDNLRCMVCEPHGQAWGAVVNTVTIQ
jgi:hypothetical protein